MSPVRPFKTEPVPGLIPGCLLTCTAKFDNLIDYHYVSQNSSWD